MADVTLEALLEEGRTFPPSPEFVEQTLLGAADLEALRAEADDDFEAYWARQARTLLHWDQDFTTTCEWDLPNAASFTGGRLNMSYNCLDRHVADGHGDQVAFLWEGEPGDSHAQSVDPPAPYAASGPRRRHAGASVASPRRGGSGGGRSGAAQPWRTHRADPGSHRRSQHARRLCPGQRRHRAGS